MMIIIAPHFVHASPAATISHCTLLKTVYTTTLGSSTLSLPLIAHLPQSTLNALILALINLEEIGPNGQL